MTFLIPYFKKAPFGESACNISLLLLWDQEASLRRWGHVSEDLQSFRAILSAAIWKSARPVVNGNVVVYFEPLFKEKAPQTPQKRRRRRMEKSDELDELD